MTTDVFCISKFYQLNSFDLECFGNKLNLFAKTHNLEMKIEKLENYFTPYTYTCFPILNNELFKKIYNNYLNKKYPLLPEDYGDEFFEGISDWDCFISNCDDYVCNTNHTDDDLQNLNVLKKMKFNNLYLFRIELYVPGIGSNKNLILDYYKDSNCLSHSKKNNLLYTYKFSLAINQEEYLNFIKKNNKENTNEEIEMLKFLYERYNNHYIFNFYIKYDDFLEKFIFVNFYYSELDYSFSEYINLVKFIQNSNLQESFFDDIFEYFIKNNLDISNEIHSQYLNNSEFDLFSTIKFNFEFIDKHPF